ncbi:MAG: hypothetical protein ACK5OB_11220 [Pirellula sp.]
MSEVRPGDRTIEDGWLLDSPERSLSWSRQAARDPRSAATLRQYLYMQMAASDLLQDDEAMQRVELPTGLLANLEEKNRLLEQLKAPIDLRIEGFLADHFRDVHLDQPL